MKVGVIGGGFKPPHKGHFELAKKALTQVPGLDKLQIYVGASPSGTKDRPGFPMTQQQAIDIWKIYAKQLPGNVEILPHSNPIGAAYNAASKNPDNEVYWFLGARDEADMKDIEQRKSHLNKNAEKYPNLHVEIIDSTGTGVSGTALRRALDNNDKETALSMLPDGVDKEAVYDIIMNTPEKKMADAIDEVFANFMFEEKEIKEITKGSPVAPIAVLPSEERQKLQDYTTILQDALPDEFDVEYRQDHIRVSIPYFDKNKNHQQDWTPHQRVLPEETTGQFDFAPHIASILEYCMSNEMHVTPIPEVKLIHDEDNAANLFGRTGYYQPENQLIALYITGRHPKDVLRSFCHELIHHMQNLEGKDLNFYTTDVHADEKLKEIEQEAHAKGSFLFRDWENSNKEQAPVEEGTKYRSIVVDVRKAVNAALNTLLSGEKLKGYNVETKREPSEKEIEMAKKYGFSPLGLMLNVEKQTAYLGAFESKSEKGTPTELEVNLKFALSDEVKKGTFYIDGEASSDEGSIDIILAFNPEDGTNMLQKIQPTLTDLIRHETEHLTQSGVEEKPTKWMRADQARRLKIRQNPELFYKYFLLPKEVDANIQGLYAKAKYEKKDFQQVVDDYLTDLVGDGIITQANSKQIYNKWKTRTAEIGGLPELR